MLPNNSDKEKDKIIREKLKGIQPEWDKNAMWDNLDSILPDNEPPPPSRKWPYALLLIPFLFLGLGIGIGLHISKPDVQTLSHTQGQAAVSINNMQEGISQKNIAQKQAVQNSSIGNKIAATQQVEEKTAQTSKRKTKQSSTIATTENTVSTINTTHKTTQSINNKSTINNTVSNTASTLSNKTSISNTTSSTNKTNESNSLKQENFKQNSVTTSSNNTANNSTVNNNTSKNSTLSNNIDVSTKTITQVENQAIEQKTATATDLRETIEAPISIPSTIETSQDVPTINTQKPVIQSKEVEINKEDTKEISKELKSVLASVSNLPSRSIVLASSAEPLTAPTLDPKMAANGIDILPLLNKNKGFYISAYGGIAQPFRQLSTGGLDVVSFANDLESNQQLLEANEIGFNIAYKSAKNWFVETGVNRLQINERYQKEISSQKYYQIMSDTAYYYIQQNQRVNVADSVQVSETNYTKTTQYFEHNLINVPVLVGFDINKNNWNLAISAGPSFNLSYAYKGKFDGSINELSTQDFNMYKTNLGIALQSKFALGYHFNDRHQVFTELNYRYLPSSVTTSDSGFTQKYATLGLNLGYKIKL